MNPRVSTALPAYNAAATLPTALDSLLAQSLTDHEIIVADDGSQDETGRIAEDYARRDARVRVLRLPHRGIVPALNACLAAASAPYIARMDADDRCHPERLALQAAYLDERPDIGLVACRVGFGGCVEANAGYKHYVDWINSLTEPEAIALSRFVESPLAHPSVMFRAGAVRDVGGYRDGDFPEDYELWLRLAEDGVSMAKLGRELLVWNESPERLSRCDARYAPEAFYRIKAPYLARWLAANNPQHPRVWIVGAGRLTRKRAEMLVGHGVAIAGYVDIDPRKVGRLVHGRPVVHREELPPPGERFYLPYVASRGAREEIVTFLESRGHVLGRDFIPAA